MKKKTSSKPVIETILDRKFDELIDRMDSKFVTKVNLLDVELRVSKKFEEQGDVMKEYRNEIMNKMDKVIGELEIHRIEQDGIKHDIKDLKKHFSN